MVVAMIIEIGDGLSDIWMNPNFNTDSLILRTPTSFEVRESSTTLDPEETHGQLSYEIFPPMEDVRTSWKFTLRCAKTHKSYRLFLKRLQTGEWYVDLKFYARDKSDKPAGTIAFMLNRAYAEKADHILGITPPQMAVWDRLQLAE